MRSNASAASFLIKSLRPLPFQIRTLVLQGERPQVPAHESLPNPEGGNLFGLDSYCQLIRWVLATALLRLQQLLATWQATRLAPQACCQSLLSSMRPRRGRLSSSGSEGSFDTG